MQDVAPEHPTAIDAAAFRRWCAASLAALRRHQRDIDELNVFPVPDGDTGTNMVATMTAGVVALDGAGEGEGTPVTELGGALRTFARGALLGARGNSGVILAQFFRGIADAWLSKEAERPAEPPPGSRGHMSIRPDAARSAASPATVITALRVAADACRAAVAVPAEGTMLSIADAAADAVAGRGRATLADIAVAAARAAAEALARTPDQLPALARAGVVDSGGFGLALVLDALAEVATGTATGAAVAAASPARRGAGRALPLAPTARETGSDEYAYEVQYLLDAANDEVERLRLRLTKLGDSLVVVGTGMGDDRPTWNVHVHVNDVGAAIEAGIEAGRPHRISVTRFTDDHKPADHDHAGHGAPPPAPTRAVVAVSSGDGLTEVFAAESATPVTSNPPSTADILAAIRSTGAADVILLPNDGNSQSVADSAAQLARADGYRVAVVPTRSPVQALAALAVRDPGRRFDDDVIAMAEAAGACRHAALTIAAREALTTAGRCSPGDVLGLAENDVVIIGGDLGEVACELLDRMCAAGGELVTLVTGRGLPARVREDVRAHLARRWPLVEVAVYHGGQPRHPLLMGVE